MGTRKTRKWRVTLRRWEDYEVRDIEAATAEGAKEWAMIMYGPVRDIFDHLDGGFEGVDAEEEE